MSYKVEVEAFKGPMDLLLSLIKKQEIDIYDIPINIITDQFLDYINEMEELNLEITSEFLVMAATLIEIKSKMLLPKEKTLEDGVEIEIDPRDELVQRLVEYEAYREVAEKLKESEIIESKVFYKPREDLSIFDDPVEELGNLDLDKLLIAINTIISRKDNDEDLIDFEELHREEYTLNECINSINIRLSKSSKVLFSELLSIRTSKEEVIAFFLSILELVRLKSIYIEQDESFSDINIIRRTEEEL